MANIFDTLIPYFAADTVGIFDQNYNQLFRDARAIKAVVKEEAKLMMHPVESGATITDHRIILPVEIELAFILRPATYRATYKALKQIFINADLLIVQTRSGVYQNQLIAQMPHEEDPDLFDTLAIAVTLRQVQFVTAEFAIKPSNPSNTTKKDRGTLQPKTVDNGTVASDIVERVFK